MFELRPYQPGDLESVHSVINDGAEAYRGVIPPECWHDPYMPIDALADEIAAGVHFTLACAAHEVLAVMGIQDQGEVALIRHAYVRRGRQRRGLGGLLLDDLRSKLDKPLLIGTWAAASWALAFYTQHGFGVVGHEEGVALLERYWSVPPQQIANSIVLTNRLSDSNHDPDRH